MNYQEYAKDLLILAATLATHADDLPLPKRDLPIDFEILVDEARDVIVAAQVLDGVLSAHNGHTRATVDLGSVHLKFIHISDESMTRYYKREALLKTLVSS